MDRWDAGARVVVDLWDGRTDGLVWFGLVYLRDFFWRETS